MRRAVFSRAHSHCEYCGCPESLSPSPFSVEHITPLASGGKTDLENLACACQGCNLMKADHMTGCDPASGQMARLFHPRTDRWADHFQWSADGAKVVPQTAIGRATVDRLNLNRSGLRNLRLLIRQATHSFPLE